MQITFFSEEGLFGVTPTVVTAGVFFGLGVLFLLYGWHAYRITLVATGVLVGGGVGALLAGVVELHPLIFALPLGILAGVLAILLEKVGAFLVGGLCGAIPVIALRAEFPAPWVYYVVALIGFVIAGIIALYFWRLVMVVFLTIIGSAFIVNGIGLAVERVSPGRAEAWSLKHPVLIFVAMLILILFGVYFQMGEKAERAEEKSGG